MSYIDCIHNRDKDEITVIERDENGKRQYVTYPVIHTFYYKDAKGKYRSVYGDPLSKFTSRKNSEFQKELKMHSGKGLFERCRMSVQQIQGKTCDLLPCGRRLCRRP